jgi:bifunctional non-homologous end joining protein LigD
VKTSSGKGLHVVAPLAPQAHWDEVKAYARGISEEMARAEPSLYTASMAKKARTGRIFVDYLRNGRGATAVAPYSTRARPGPPVSTPVSWDELRSGIRGDSLDIAAVVARLSRLDADPWAQFFKIKQGLPAAKR